MDSCPSDDDLQQFLSGGGLTVEIGSHLSDCGRCREAIERLSDDGTLREYAASLAAGPLTWGGGAELSHLVDALRDQGPTDVWEEAGKPAARALGPPRAAGEIGALGPYSVEAEIGRGGMGVVYLARDRTIGRVVAVKVLRPERVDDRARARFIREVRSAARVEHDHVVRVYATSEPADPIPYFVMEYVAGPSLAGLIRDRGRLDPREAAAIVAQAADGLAAAHAAGLVHRDVKPANILIEPAGGRAKIGDFGLARLDSEAGQITVDGSIAGTPAYFSPEQARGEGDADARSDVYSLGVTLYECLAGECPFRGSSHRIIQQVLHDEPRPPRALNDLVPRDLETICLKAMAKEPTRRYPGAAELAADLRRWLAGEPIRARPAGPIERSWRLGRRHPRVAALAAALALAMTVGISGVLWQWRRAEANAREANVYLSKALDSIDSYFVKVSENRLLDVPNLQPLRKELLVAARDYYESLLRDRPDDPAIRLELAKARASLAAVVSVVGSTDEAIGHFRRSLAELDRIVEQGPGNLPALRSRLTCLINLGKVQIAGSRLDDARATYLRLRDEGETLRRARPEDLEPLQAGYAALHGIGFVSYLKNTGPDEMIADFERAVVINGLLLARKPDSPAYLRNLSRTSGILSDIYRTRGQADDARVALDRSYGAAARLVADHPESQDYRFGLANLERQRGLIQLLKSLTLKGPAAMAELDQAGPAFDRALALDRALVRENPGVDSYRIDNLGLLAYAAATKSCAGRGGEGLALLREASQLASSVENHGSNTASLMRAKLDILVLTAYAHSEDGRAEEALGALDEADRILGSLTPPERSNATAFAFQDLRVAFVRAVVLRESGRVADAVKSWARAEELTPAPSRPLIAFLREMHNAEATHAAGADVDRALSVIPLVDSECASEILPGGAYVIYAKVYALAAPAAKIEARESLAAHAVFCLEKAGDAGYFSRRGRLDRIEGDAAFLRIIDHPEYLKFRQGLRVLGATGTAQGTKEEMDRSGFQGGLLHVGPRG